MSKDLTPEQIAVVDQLLEADRHVGEKYKFDDLYQKKIISMLLVDRFFVIQAMDLIKPTYFTNDAHVLFARLLFKYFEKYKTMPENWFFSQEVKESLTDRDDAIKLYYLAELKALYEYYKPGVESRAALLDKITNFAKQMAVKFAFGKSIEEINKSPEPDWGKVYEFMRDSMRVERNFDPGLQYFTETEEMFRLMAEQQEIGERFTTAFKSLDDAITNGSPLRGELYGCISLPGRGKSISLTKTAVENVKLGHKVLYISLEMDQVSVAQRFTAQFMQQDINCLMDNKDDILEMVNEFKKGHDDPNFLIVKQFPGGEIDVNTVRAYYSQLELMGWKPDLLILDYINEFKSRKGVSTYESLYLDLRDLRGFGVEQNHLTFTACQPNRSAAELADDEYITENNIGSSFDLFRSFDGFWSINQTRNEKKAQVGRIYDIKTRRGKSQFAIRIGFDYDKGTLNIFETSDYEYKKRVNAIEQLASEGVNIPPKRWEKKNPIIEPEES